MLDILEPRGFAQAYLLEMYDERKTPASMEP